MKNKKRVFPKGFKDKKGAGFTLIEIMVVIAIIGLLAAVVVTSLYNSRIKARNAKRKEDAMQLRLALDWYFHDNHNQYPNGGTVGNQPNNEIDIQTLTSFLTPTYILKIPDDPANGPANYQYVWKNNGQDYGLLVPFGNDGGISCMWKTSNGSSQWFKSGSITVPDCTYQN